MAFPTGTGSERIKYTKLDDIDATTQALITGVALHIYTVVSIIVTELSGSAESFQISITDSNGSSNPCYVIYDQALAGYDTFVLSDRFSFDGDKKIMIGSTTGPANFDAVCTYIDQDWT